MTEFLVQRMITRMRSGRGREYITTLRHSAEFMMDEIMCGKGDLEYVRLLGKKLHYVTYARAPHTYSGDVRSYTQMEFFAAISEVLGWINEIGLEDRKGQTEEDMDYLLSKARP